MLSVKCQNVKLLENEISSVSLFQTNKILDLKMFEILMRFSSRLVFSRDQNCAQKSWTKKRQNRFSKFSTIKEMHFWKTFFFSIKIETTGQRTASQ